MIRHAFDLAWVQQEIAKLDPNWLDKAASRTSKLIEQCYYAENSAIWSVVKPVYIRLQHNKCIYCERQFENAEIGCIEHDLEHFRPKSAVDHWPDPHKHPFQYDFPTGTAANGYYWLAYDLHNYAASCKVCNSKYKHTYFPVRAARVGISAAVPSITALAQEEALLCYPLGDVDDDPEDLITFDATTAVPVHASGKKHERAKLIIDFFGLNEREQLHIDRARMICVVGASCERQAQGVASETDLAVLQQLHSPHLPHSACLKAFARAWGNDAAYATKVYQQCQIRALQSGRRDGSR